MFSLKKGGLPLSIIKGGKYNNKILYLHDAENIKNAMPIDPISLLDENMFVKNRKTLNLRQMNELYQAIQQGHEVFDPDLKDFYNKGRKHVTDRMYKEVQLNDGILQQIPNPKTRDVLYVSGMGGAGKSTYTGKFVGEYNKMFPKNKVFVFSRFKEDPALDQYDITRILLDDSFLDYGDSDDHDEIIKIIEPRDDDIDNVQEQEYDDEEQKEDIQEGEGLEKKKEKIKLKKKGRIIIKKTVKKQKKEPKPIDLDIFSNSLVIFDDIDTIGDNKIKKEVMKIRDDLLECGRKKNIYMVVTSHLVCNYGNTRTSINEATSSTFFRNANAHHIKRFLREYVGIDDKVMIEKIRNLPSRWVTIVKAFPKSCVLHESGAFIL